MRKWPKRLAGVLAVVGAAVAGGCAAQKIGFSESSPCTVVVSGLHPKTLNGFDALPASRQKAVLRLLVAGAEGDVPNVLGEVSRHGQQLVFTPRFPIEPGLRYLAEFNVNEIDARDPADRVLVADLMIPRQPAKAVTQVAMIYPSSDVLPENLLKFYIQFSGPMSRGEAYRHIHLFNDAGEPVPYPFLELGEELWNPEMTRFTLFFDPGRIKQGLVPRLEAGPALVSGKRYTLQIDADWRDGEQRPLVGSARKDFRTRAADVRQPDPARWEIHRPSAESKWALIVDFDESLDYALLQRTIVVVNSGGEKIDGEVAIDENEKRWSFTPRTAWKAGRYVLRVETILEDNSGNSVGRPFEVDLNQGEKPEPPAQVDVPFVIERGTTGNP